MLFPRTARVADAALVQGGWLMATIHPSAVLRADDGEAAVAGLVADLRVAGAAL